MAEINKINIKGIDYDIGGGGSNDLVINLTNTTTDNPFQQMFVSLLLSWVNLNNFLFNTSAEEGPTSDVYVLETTTAEALTNGGYDVNKIAQGYYDNIIVNLTLEGKTAQFVFTREYIAPLGGGDLDWSVLVSAAYILKLSYGDTNTTTYNKLIAQLSPVYEAATDSESTYKLTSFNLTIIQHRVLE